MSDIDQIYLEFKDGDNDIIIEPIKVMYPHAELAWDRSWIESKVKIRAGVFSGELTTEIMLVEFQSFRDELQKLDTDLNSNIFFAPIESQVKFEISGDGLGHFELYCEVDPDPHLANLKLNFRINFDQTLIKDYVYQLGKILDKFSPQV